MRRIFFLLGMTLFCLEATTTPNFDRHFTTTMAHAKEHQGFKAQFFAENEQKFAQLVENGQRPPTLLIGCSDSRVIPELITMSRPGELFVIRSAGNFVPTYNETIAWDGIAASIQYAVDVLKIKDVIVLGHSQCGAIEALFKKDLPPLIGNWIEFGREAQKEASLPEYSDLSQEERLELATKLSVIYQLQHLTTYPFIRDAVEAERLDLHGWYFDIRSGEIDFFDPEKELFLPISSTIHEEALSK